MEAKYLYRMCLVFTAMSVLSLFTHSVQQSNVGTHQGAQEAQYPLASLLSSVRESFDMEIKRTFNPPVVAKNDILTDNIYNDNAPADLPANIVYGLINNEDVWNIKIGPFTDASYVKELSRLLLANNFTITLKSDKSESGNEYNIFINSSSDKKAAAKTISELANRYHLTGIHTKNYS